MNALLARLVAVANVAGVWLSWDVLLQATLLLLAAWVATFLLRSSAAAVRHRIWCLTLISLMILPALRLLRPVWNLPVLPRWPDVRAVLPSPPRSNSSALAARVIHDEQPESAIHRPDRFEPFPGEMARRMEGLMPGGHADAPSRTRAADAPSAVKAAPADSPVVSAFALPLSWRDRLLVVWLLGWGVALLRVVAGVVTRCLFGCNARPMVDAEADRLLAELRQQLGVRCLVRLLATDATRVPMTAGLWRPAIVLPSTWYAWRAQRRRVVLLHELAHIKRWDVGFQLLARLACAVYWFHPLAWHALRRMRIERELASDDCVLMAGERSSDYAQELLAIARDCRLVSLSSAVAMAQSSHLEQRVRAMLDQAHSHLPLSRTAGRRALLGSAVLVIGVGLLGPIPTASSRDEPSAASPSAISAEKPQASTPSGVPLRATMKQTGWDATYEMTLRKQGSNQDSPSRKLFDDLCRTAEPQSFSLMVEPNGSKRTWSPNRGRTPAFDEIVKREPKYASPQPFRGVVKFGSQNYAFAFDMVSVNPEETTSSTAPANSPLGRVQRRLAKALTPPKLLAYDRLYFDFNHNGDLTDDRVIEAEPGAGHFVQRGTQRRWRITFPQTDLTIDVDGAPVQYAFIASANADASPENSWVGVGFRTAVYYEGDIVAEGKKHHVVLIDGNSNGRFDDTATLAGPYYAGLRMLFLAPGDLLLVDPPERPNRHDSLAPYAATRSEYVQPVSKMLNVGGHFYDVKVAATGDEISLSPATVPLGHITSANDKYCAIVYGDRGFLKISGKKGEAVAVPEGRWNLLGYTIDRVTLPTTNQTGEYVKVQKNATTGGDASPLAAIAGRLRAALNDAASVTARQSVPGRTCLSAAATRQCKPIEVKKGATVELPFGPPYKIMLKAVPSEDGKQITFEAWVVGSAGERCTNDRYLLPPMQFTIKGPDGRVIKRGNLQFSGLANYRYVWSLPSGDTKEYRVRADVGPTPFAIEPSDELVVRPPAAH
jgi:beta-lactamase regulating signal transducer with metallopeptidase domain